MPPQIPARNTSKYAGQYAATFDSQRMVEIFTDSYRIALSSKNPDTAGDRYALAVETYHQLMSMGSPRDVRDTAQKAMEDLVDQFPAQVLVNEALGLREKARKLKTPKKQLDLLQRARKVLDRGVIEHPTSPGLQAAVADVSAEIANLEAGVDSPKRMESSMKVRFSDIETTYSARGIPSYRMELWHDGLKKHRLIRGTEADVVKRKARIQAADWEEKWEKIRTQQVVQKAREHKKEYQEQQKALATERTRNAQKALDMLDRTLEHTLSIDDTIDWEQIKDASPFPDPPPTSPSPPAPPDDPTYPQEPSENEERFTPKVGFLDRLIGSRRAAKEALAANAFQKAHEEWVKQTARLQDGHRQALQQHAARLDEAEKRFGEKHRDWDNRRHTFLAMQQESNAAIDRQRERYLKRETEAIEEYCDLVLSRSTYPDWMPHEFELSYNPDNATLLVSYSLPSLGSIPKLREVIYVQSRDEFNEKELSDPQVRTLYDSLVYQITLRTVHELFEADQIHALESVVFNGYVTSVDPRTGQIATACILSLQAVRDEFIKISLAQVDPKACFKAMKGVGSSKLHSLTPIAPIMEMRREDGRFVSAREMANTLDDSVNLAIMDWEDFEHLIREVFEEEFRSGGGEVKVTQASRDGGVDAVAFDPDPIRGGKIVIQAKRYTNTVGVAAVRDLYGTVMNEGATKGILVTTSDYGPDAYSFAKDKPLVLMNGANLLHLLGKHGHKAQIDIRQAKDQLRGPQ